MAGISDEDIEYLRRLAERVAITRGNNPRLAGAKNVKTMTNPPRRMETFNRKAAAALVNVSSIKSEE